jgi:HipA-like protein
MMARGFVDKLGDVLSSWGLFMTSEAPAKNRPRRELRLYLPVKGQRVWVGTLSQDKGEYSFKYSDAFIGRQDLPPISGFPEKLKVYASKSLWPFFQARLPSTDRPDVKELLRARNVDPNDTFVLLAELGKKTITSPYEFELY